MGAKTFMNVIIQLLNNKEISQQVKKKILQLIQNWGIRFEDQTDVLPIFTSVYTALKSKNLPFADEDEARGQVRQLKDALEGKAAMPDGKPLDKKHQKLKKDLEVVMENVVLSNQMIDAHDIDEEVDTNDALITLVQQVQSFDNKIMELIGKIKNDQVMHLALTTNDDMLRTMKRFKKLEHGRVPEKFKPECRKFLPGYKGSDEKPKPTAKKPAPAKKAPAFVEKEPEPVGRSGGGAGNIFGDEPVAASQQPPASKGPGDDLFDLDFSNPAPSTGTAPTENPSSSGGSNVSLLNDIMGKMTLDKQQEQQQFNTGMPGMGAPPMGNPGMGAPPMGGPGMGPPGGFGGPAPGMFNTGMPPQNMGGNNFGGGFNNFNTGFPGGGMGGPPPMNPGFAGGMGQPNPGFGGAPSADPFSGGGSTGLFGAGGSNYNPGGGPEAFKNKQKPKKEGPKEFNDLFGMADKISDRQNQPTNAVDDYVTSYKNSYSEPGGYDNFGADPGAKAQNDANDFFGGGNDAPQDNYGGGFDNSQQQQPQAQTDAFGYAQPAQDSSGQNLEDDFFGGGGDAGVSQPQSDPFSGQDDSQQDFNNYGGGNDGYNQQPAEAQNYGQSDPFGGQDYSQQPAEQQQQPPQQNSNSNQEELFDIFG